MKIEPKTLQEFETIYANKLANDITNAQGHIEKLTERLNVEVDESEKSRLTSLIELHTSRKAELMLTDSTIAAIAAKARQDEMIKKIDKLKINK